MLLNKVAYNRFLISNMLDREGHHQQFSNVFKNAVMLDLLLTYKFQIKNSRKNCLDAFVNNFFIQLYQSECSVGM